MLSCPILYFILKYTELSSEICIDTHRDSSAWHVLKSTFLSESQKKNFSFKLRGGGKQRKRNHCNNTQTINSKSQAKQSFIPA